MALRSSALVLVAPLFLAALGAACAKSDEVDEGGDGGTTQTSGQGPSSSTSGDATLTSGSGGSGSSTGTGGASSATTTSGAGGAGGGMSDDPCAGASDGAHCGTELGGLADHNSVYVCSGGVTQSAMGCQNGCSNGACNPVAADPCASAQFGNGAYCGGSLSGGDVNKLYQCQNGATASTEDCPAGCQVQPPGVPDNCKPQGDPCAQANAGNGLYCGGSLGTGDPNTLYDCQNNATASSTLCPAGCQMNPPGVADACAPNGGGGCCVNQPPGVLTQSYSACGNGGSHYGVDYGTAIGTPIYAGISGTVVSSALGYPNCYNNGCDSACWNAFNYVKLKSDCGDPNVGGNDFYVYYLHINDLAPGVSNGTHVNQGELLAYAGNSGCSSGPHIHIETVSVGAGQSAKLNTCSSVNPTSRYCP